MIHCKKYLSVFLLFVFTWLLLPPVLLHHFFADHQDTVCDFKHRHDVTTVESLHTHCDIFTTNAPLYDAPQLTVITQPERILIAEIDSRIHFLHLESSCHNIAARAPPFV